MRCSGRHRLIHGVLIVFCLVLLGRAVQVQVLQHAQWVARAQRQHRSIITIPAPRGRILDEAGRPLAQSRAMVRIGIAPREVRNPNAIAAGLTALHVPARVVKRVTDTARTWVVVPGTFWVADIGPLADEAGVHLTSVVDRVYIDDESLQRILGHVSPDGRGRDGMERELDSLLRGTPGQTTLLRDGSGQPLIGASTPPIAGHDVTLTINSDLQEIAERALAEAIERTSAVGGDVVILDPRDGAVRALVSLRPGANPYGLPALTEPFEPGSTMKPFVAAALLSLGRATPTDTVDTENGHFTLEGRTIHDEHKASSMTLAGVIAFSSNIGISKFVYRLSPDEEYQALRTFGFGRRTGIAYPIETRGVLRPPERWSPQSRASLAMGYELSVTVLQLAVAYGAIANDGILVKPALVEEVRSATGALEYRRRPQVVGHPVSKAAARAVLEMLRGTVESGTAREAGLSTFALAGKTGTARRTINGRYGAGEYTSSFIGLFPADRPQFVVVVKLDSPKTEVYGGQAAAPVSKAILQAALAMRRAALDRRALARRQNHSLGRRASIDEHTPPALAAVMASAESRLGTPATASSLPPAAYKSTSRVRFALGDPLPTASPTSARPTTVPNVRGLTTRAAVYRLHRAGLRVVPMGTGIAAASDPPAGDTLPTGTIVRLFSTPLPAPRPSSASGLGARPPGP